MLDEKCNFPFWINKINEEAMCEFEFAYSFLMQSIPCLYTLSFIDKFYMFFDSDAIVEMDTVNPMSRTTTHEFPMRYIYFKRSGNSQDIAKSTNVEYCHLMFKVRGNLSEYIVLCFFVCLVCSFFFNFATRMGLMDVETCVSLK